MRFDFLRHTASHAAAVRAYAGAEPAGGTRENTEGGQRGANLRGSKMVAAKGGGEDNERKTQGKPNNRKHKNNSSSSIYRHLTQ
jgi:hypothetical protein